MKKGLIILSIFLFNNIEVISQNELSQDINNTSSSDSLKNNNRINEIYNPLSPPNTYQNIDNPNYWKNKMPDPGYWQQDIYYNIKASIDEKTDIITATQQLTYWNNSPDNLDVVYFHLYQNAFQPESYYDELQKQNGKNPYYGIYERNKLGTNIEKMLVNGQEVATELDNTILKVYLPYELKSGESISFDIAFKTYFDEGEVRRRMKVYDAWGNRHYNGVHWYPRICVYDSKFGWTRDQHLGREFYGNFGTFDVELTFASNFIVEATGFLQNRDEMLPKDLREKLDVKNFKDKKWNSPPSTIIEYKEGETKTWIYHAENVHDFAFTADPTYRIGESWWEDKVCYSLVQEPHAAKWQNAADFGAKCLKVFSEDFGRYVYHKVIVADASSGMEYPMITLDGGSDPGYRDLLAHEIGHMWFFGQVGNNETYRALLDEGFTQFLTAWAMIKIDGEYMVEDKSKHKWIQKFKKPLKAIDSEIYNAYMYDATKSNDPIISTHSDCFNGALRHGGGYRHVYYKTAAMLYNLQYVLGDDLFLDAMKNYFNSWKIAHPYEIDFKNAMIQYTGVDLNWFFDQWLDTDKRLDYAVTKVEEIYPKSDNQSIFTQENNGDHSYKITFKRKARMQMPIDFRIVCENGTSYEYHIPNNWFVKKTNAEVLTKWHGWDLIHPTYTTKVITLPSKIHDVIIDPTHRLADSYMLDNSMQQNITYEIDHRIQQYPDWKNYEIKYRPDIWWNNYDGVKLGFHTSGGYLRHHHLYDATIWINSGKLANFKAADFTRNQEKSISDQYDKFSYRINYSTNLDKISLHSKVKIHSRFLAGLHKNSLAISKSDAKRSNKISVKFLSMYRPKESSRNYLLYPDMWGVNKLNNRIDVNIEHNYKYSFGKGKINLELQSSAIGSDYDYAKIILTTLNENKIGRLNMKLRGIVQFGSGNNWAPESKLHLAGANNEELMNSKFTRSAGWISMEDVGFGNTTNNFHSTGGLNLRGYAGYLVPDFDEDGNWNPNHVGKSGAGINTQIDFTQYTPHIIRYFLDLDEIYMFSDAGIITNEKLNKENFQDVFSELRMDAGIGFAMNIFEDASTYNLNIKPLYLRVDFPLFLNRPPADQEFFQFRWIAGLEKAL